MNMPFTLPAHKSSISELVIADEYAIKNDLVYFSLVHPKTSNVFINAVVAAKSKQVWTIWNTTSDPQNDIDVDFDSLEVDSNSRPIVEDCDEVDLTQNQSFRLNENQIQLLNAMIFEHFEEEKVNELKGVKA